MASDKRIILITGCSSGIGYEASYTLANASPSHHVIFTARSPTKGKPALEEIQARKPAGTLSWLELDVTSDASIEAAADAVGRDFGKLDVLINNAAITEPMRLHEQQQLKHDRETLRKVFDTNAFGPLLLTQAMEPLLKKSPDPVIIDVSTGLGSVTMKADIEGPYAPVLYDVYRGSKAAMNMFSQCERYNFRKWAKVHTMSPGFVISNLSGPEDLEFRKKNGGLKPEFSAGLLLQIVEGKMDKDMGKLLDHEGGTYPW